MDERTVGIDSKAYRSVTTAPKDGTMVRLLVRPGAGEEEGWTPFADSTAPYHTIGFNDLVGTGDDQWHFAGWDWVHDCFTAGAGEVIGWLPFQASAIDHAEIVKRVENVLSIPSAGHASASELAETIADALASGLTSKLAALEDEIARLKKEYKNNCAIMDEGYLTLIRENKTLRELVRSFVLNEIDYMTRNNLGDPEKQHNVKWARDLGITDTALPAEGKSDRLHPSHKHVRSSIDSSTFDMICDDCGNHDKVTGGWGLLAEPCPAAPSSQAQEGGAVECHGLDTPERVCFYEQDFYVLSNFSSFRVWWRGRNFDTSEAAYHWAKFPDRPDIQFEIETADSAHEAFKYAEGMKPHRRSDWDDIKVDIMRDILRAKVGQHEYVRRKLLATGDRELVENSWRDDFWGWGPNRDGKNMLGRLWMEVRAELRAAQAQEDGR